MPPALLVALAGGKLSRRGLSHVQGKVFSPKQAPRRVSHHPRGMADRHLWSVVDVAHGTCAVPTCDRPSAVRGWCDGHYRRWKEHGEVFPERPLRERWHVTVIVGDQKRCSRCGEFKSLDEYAKRTRSPDGYTARCKLCQRAYWEATRERRLEVHRQWVRANQDHVRAYREANKERERAQREARRDRTREQANARNRVIRDEVLEAYGGACACCGETERAFLQIDHVNGDGAEHRRAMGTNRVERWLRKHGYPEGFRVLCANCNWARHLNGGVCPHEETVGRQLGLTA